MILAVISDLHVGFAARAKDLCPEPSPAHRKERNTYNLKAEANYRQSFIDLIQKEHIHADYLVLPGDLTNAAKPQEVKLVSEFALEAADALGVPRSKILFAPGNHDLDWSMYDPDDSTGIRWGQRYGAIGHSAFCFRHAINNGVGDVLAPPHFTAWFFGDLFAVAYNSASHDDPLGKQHIHHGLADPNDMTALRQYLASIRFPDDLLRLFIVHHHPIDFSNPVPGTPDFSLMANAESLLTVLHEFQFDFLLHGHRHHPRFDTHSTQSYPHLPILCAGSFSVEIDTQWAGTVENQFHLVKIDGRNGVGNHIKGTVVSWANNRARGWHPSEESSCGIRHIVPFGNYVMPSDLDALIEPLVRARLNSQHHVLWHDVLQEFRNLEHLPPTSAEAAFTRMAARFDCDLYLNTSIHGLMLILRGHTL